MTACVCVCVCVCVINAKNEPFSTAERSERVEIFFFAQRANTQKQALNKRPLPCDAMAPTVQNHAGARLPGLYTSVLRAADTSALRTADQQLYNHNSLTSWAHRVSLSKRTELLLHRTGDRCHAMPWRQQSRNAQARVPGSNTSALRAADTSVLRAANQQLYNRTSLTSWAHRGSLSKRRELVQLAHPPPPTPLFFADSRPPVSKVACLIFLFLLSTCMYHTFSHITFLGYNHMHSRASVFLDSLLSEHISFDDTMCPWRRLLPGYDTRFFLQRECCQCKEVVPIDHIRGKGLSSRLASGSKIRLTAGFEPCLQGLAPVSLAAPHSLVQCVPCFVHSIPVLAASHSSLA